MSLSLASNYLYVFAIKRPLRSPAVCQAAANHGRPAGRAGVCAEMVYGPTPILKQTLTSFLCSRGFVLCSWTVLFVFPPVHTSSICQMIGSNVLAPRLWGFDPKLRFPGTSTPGEAGNRLECCPLFWLQNNELSVV